MSALPVPIETEAGQGARVPGEGGARASSSTVLELPMPPSVNKIWSPRKGGIRLSDAYRLWRDEAGWRLRLQRPQRVAGSVVALISVERHEASADIDNRVKAILDLLVTHDVIDDDRFVTGLAISWAPAANRLARIMILPAARMAVEFIPAADGATGGWFLDAELGA